MQEADVVVGAGLPHGAKAPMLIKRKMLKTMKPGAFIVDVVIDQGRCFEISKPTTQGRPIYDVDGIIHYCVANMLGAARLPQPWDSPMLLFLMQLQLLEMAGKSVPMKVLLSLKD